MLFEPKEENKLNRKMELKAQTVNGVIYHYMWYVRQSSGALYLVFVLTYIRHWPKHGVIVDCAAIPTAIFELMLAFLIEKLMKV